MIGYLSGTVLKNDGKNVLLLVNNVGYDITVPVDTAAQLHVQGKGGLYTYLHVRENEIALYGFENEAVLFFFKQLLTVSGVGPRMGIELMSVPFEQVKQAIVEENKSFLTSIKGVGEKLASRLILELKNKIQIDFDRSHPLPSAVNMDVVLVLEKLGYDRSRVIKLMKHMTDVIEDEEELIKYCLKHL